jgi:SAM-dependent methyltransferase
MDAALYEQHAELEQEHWWFVARRAIIGTVLDHHLERGADRRLLDVGCGTGGMLPLLAQFGTVSGIEGEPLAVEHCRAAFGRFDVQLGQVPSDVPHDGSFDLVSAFDVIEHIDDDVEALAALRAAVRPGGLIVVTVPALPWLWSAHDDLNGHKRRYTRQSLTAALTRAGVEVAALSYFNTVLLPAVAAARLVQHLRPRPAAPHSDFRMPTRWVNRALTRAMASERGLVARGGLPIGVSLVAVATPAR